MRILLSPLVILINILLSAQTEEPDPFSFFPSRVGNYWEYDPQRQQYNYTILRDSIDEDGSKFLFFHDPPYRGPNYKIDTSVNVFVSPQFSNLLEYKLTADSGDTWWYSKDRRQLARVEDTYQAYVFGEITNVKRIEYYEINEEDTTITETSLQMFTSIIASGFGLIWQGDGATQPKVLHGCIINGKKYGSVVSVEVEDVPPLTIFLKQNYPNPFNPTTTIEYSVAKAGFIQLEVYNILGERITSLVEGYKTAGNYKVLFDITEVVEKLSSGVYV